MLNKMRDSFFYYLKLQTLIIAASVRSVLGLHGLTAFLCASLILEVEGLGHVSALMILAIFLLNMVRWIKDKKKKGYEFVMDGSNYFSAIALLAGFVLLATLRFFPGNQTIENVAAITLGVAFITTIATVGECFKGTDKTTLLEE